MSAKPRTDVVRSDRPVNGSCPEGTVGGSACFGLGFVVPFLVTPFTLPDVVDGVLYSSDAAERARVFGWFTAVTRFTAWNAFVAPTAA